MPKSVQAPSEAMALGMLAELLRRHPDGAGDAAAAVAAPDDAIVTLAATYETLRRRARDAQVSLGGYARIIAQHNQGRGEVLLRRGRLQVRMDALRTAQAQAATPEAARVLRRQRAELAVEVAELDGLLSGHDTALDEARRGHAEALATGEAAGTEARATAAALHALQRTAAPLAAAFAAIEGALGKAACRLYVAKATPLALDAWRRSVRHTGAGLLRAHTAMATGRYSKDETDAMLGGRALATGEVLCAAVAMGAMAPARTLFALACPPEQFFHQIFNVFRSYCFGLYLRGEEQALAEAVRMHRYADGVRGALANAFWALLQRDNKAFGAALQQLVRDDWRTWSHTQSPAMGLVSSTTCALARFGLAQGLAVPSTLGPTVPVGLYTSVPSGEAHF